MKFKGLLFILLFVFCSLIVVGQDKFPVNVELKVQHNSKAIQDEMYNYITRELRALGGTNIVDRDTQYIISVLMLDNKLQDGIKTGYVMSITIEEKKSALRIVKSKNRKQYTSFNYFELSENLMATAPNNGLEDIARYIAVKFHRVLHPVKLDDDALKEAAKIYKESQKKTKKQNR